MPCGAFPDRKCTYTRSFRRNRTARRIGAIPPRHPHAAAHP